MRILLTAHRFFPKHVVGTEVPTRDTGLELLARGHEVHVLTVDPEAYGRSPEVAYEDYDHRGLKVRALGLPERRSAPEGVRNEYDNPLVAEHARRYAAKGLHVPSTWYENTPLVIYEAFASKTPVVASDLGRMSEVVHHGENGLLFEPGDAGGLARQLGRLADEPGLLERLGENAGNVRTVQDSVDEALGLYERLQAEKDGTGKVGRGHAPAGVEVSDA